MLILIDGYNVIAPVAPPRRAAADWLQQERLRLLNRLADGLPADLAAQTCVVFDAAKDRSLAARMGNPAQFLHRHIDVRFAVGYREADDLIEELIRGHPSPKRLTVVSSDHRLQVASRRRGATAFDADHWLDRLMDGKPMLAVRWPPARARPAQGQPSRSDDSAEEGTTPQADDQEAMQQLLQAFTTKRAPAHEDDDPNPLPRDPRRQLDPTNPFPDGYGEDLLP